MPEEVFLIKESPIEGRGVFAAKDFEPGETICTFFGTKISVLDLIAKTASDSTRLTCDAFQVAEKEYLIIGSPYVYINHSCEPNSGFRGTGVLVAAREIRKGEEIVYDYSVTEWTPQEYTNYDYTEWPMPCRCGQSSCRKLVACFPCLPAPLREKYLDQNLIQDYIKAKASKPLEYQRCFICEKVLSNL